MMAKVNRAWMLSLLLLSSPGLATVPAGLTGWRTPQGIFLTWSGTPTSPFAIWRGTESGHLLVLATLQRGQVGFLDLGVLKDAGYLYALGTGSTPGPEIRLDGAALPVRVLSSLVTTCSGLAPGGSFPANTQNYFFPSKHPHVQYFGYFFLQPWDPSPRTARLVWKDAAGAVFSEFSHSITPKRVDLPGGAVGQVLLPQAIGLRAVLAQHGQIRVPTGPGLCTVEAFIDDVPVALTVFYLKEEAGASAPAAPRTIPGPGPAAPPPP